MNTLKTTTVLFAITLTINLFAQSNFKPGYYITNEMDTVHGLIDYRNNTKNAEKCVFIKSIEDEKSIFLPGEIHSYRITNGKYFTSKIIPIDSTQINVFCEFLINGVVNLYYYNDGENHKYYIETEQGEFVLLEDKPKTEYINGKTYEKQNLKYIGVLQYTFRNSPETMNLARNTTINHNSLMKITKNYHYNICPDSACVEYTNQKIKKIYLGINTGILKTNLLMEDEIFTDYNDHSYISPSLGLVSEFYLTRISENLAVQFNVNWSQFKHSITFDTLYIPYEGVFWGYRELKFGLISTNLNLKYVYPAGKVRPTASLGLNFCSTVNDKSYQETTIYLGGEITDKILVADYYFGYNFQVGFISPISKKILFFTNFTYQYLKEKVILFHINDENQNTFTKFKNFQISVGILYQI
jgi:hypothetical protein